MMRIDDYASRSRDKLRRSVFVLVALVVFLFFGMPTHAWARGQRLVGEWVSVNGYVVMEFGRDGVSRIEFTDTGQVVYNSWYTMTSLTGARVHGTVFCSVFPSPTGVYFIINGDDLELGRSLFFSGFLNHGTIIWAESEVPLLDMHLFTRVR